MSIDCSHVVSRMEENDRSTKQLPIVGRNYWISDGKDVALATWNMERMQWQFLYHYSVFKPSLMLPVKLPPLPNRNNGEHK